MRTPNYTTQFERDLRLAERQGKDIEKLKTILKALIYEEPLPERQRDHPWSATTKAAANATSNPTGCLSTSWSTTRSSLSAPALTVTCSSKHRLALGRAVGSGHGHGATGVTRAATLTAAPVALWPRESRRLSRR